MKNGNVFIMSSFTKDADVPTFIDMRGKQHTFMIS
jgi:hypothetical protein